MTRLAGILLLSAAACARAHDAADAAPGQTSAAAARAASAAPSAAQPTRVSFVTEGAVTRLQLRRGVVSYCDGRGSWSGDLASGRSSPDTQSCQPAAEPNTSCGDLGLDVDVRSPHGEPNDVVDVGPHSYTLPGRVHDCAADGGTLLIGTATKVTLIDTDRHETVAVSARGSDRVAIDSAWVAWFDGDSVRAARRATLR